MPWICFNSSDSHQPASLGWDTVKQLNHRKNSLSDLLEQVEHHASVHERLKHLDNRTKKEHIPVKFVFRKRGMGMAHLEWCIPNTCWYCTSAGFKLGQVTKFGESRRAAGILRQRRVSRTSTYCLAFLRKWWNSIETIQRYYTATCRGLKHQETRIQNSYTSDRCLIPT